MSCPNIDTCRLINKKGISVSRSDLTSYKKRYCNTGGYIDCKRYQVKMTEGFCPDFVLPGSMEEVEAIIRRFDEEMDQQ
jgi:hypothetical protein